MKPNALLWTLLGFVALAPAAGAQVVVSPDTVRLSLAAGEQAETALLVTNEGTAALALSAVPLPAGETTGEPGEVLFATAPEMFLRLSDLAMTDDGRLFVMVHHGEVQELTAELDTVGSFEHTPLLQRARGVAWMPPEDAGREQGTLWWLETTSAEYEPSSDCQIGIEEAALVETDLDDAPTGRTIPLAIPPAPPGGEGVFCTDVLSNLSYDAEAGLFYYSGSVDRYAVTLDGTGAEGYPVRALSGYPSGSPIWLGGFDAPADAFDQGVGLGQQAPVWRVAITYRDGVSTGAETPLAGVGPPEHPRITNVFGVQRSRLDPSVLYVAAQGAGLWVYAVRAHPVPPPWFRLAPLTPEVTPEQTDTLTVRFDASRLSPGVYEGVVALREDDPNGEPTARVPVVLTVTPPTSGEDAASVSKGVRLLAPYPNPSRGATTVPLVLGEAAEVHLVVFDVLGREVAVLHEGRLGAGEHRFVLDAALPAGAYLVRASGAGGGAVQRLTIAR